MTPEEAKVLTDEQLQMLYSHWSEEFYAAGWITAGEQEFVTWLLLPKEKRRSLQPYEEVTLRKVKKLLSI